MIDLATLTGAIIVALGQEHAGLFSNDDKLSERLSAAGLATGEQVWRMPLGPEYDKLIDSKFADMKNTGGRFGGSITAGAVHPALRRQDAVGASRHRRHRHGLAHRRVNQCWGSGFGVRLLDELSAPTTRADRAVAEIVLPSDRIDARGRCPAARARRRGWRSCSRCRAPRCARQSSSDGIATTAFCRMARMLSSLPATSRILLTAGSR